MDNVQIGHFDTLTVNWEEYKKAIESAIDEITGSLNFINFKINISKENLDKLKARAKYFVKKKKQGLNEFITKDNKFLVELSSLGGSLGEITAGLGLKNFRLDT
jgi:predicted RNA-binding protein